MHFKPSIKSWEIGLPHPLSLADYQHYYFADFWSIDNHIYLGFSCFIIQHAALAICFRCSNFGARLRSKCGSARCSRWNGNLLLSLQL